ncbi:MAG: MFS transporter [Bellilinea sp.]|nr:MFS transporter [Anaerolineaceae bacterium]
MIKKHSAETVYTVYNILLSAFFALAFTVNMVYFVTTAKLDPLQLVLVGTSLEASIFLFEIPTGIVADIVSRRLSVILGVFLMGIGTFLSGLIPVFIPILIAQVIWGLGYTFTSGALDAWISDEVGEANAGAIFLHGAKVSQYGGLAAIPISILLAQGSIATPILVSGVLFGFLGFYLIGFMPETGFHPTPREDRTTWQHMGQTLRSGANMLRVRPALVGILTIGLFIGLYSEGFDRLWNAHILEQFTFPDLFGLKMITWFGVMEAAPQLLTILAVSQVQKRADTSQTPSLVRALTALSAALIVSLLVFALAGAFWLAAVSVIAIGVVRSLIWPLYTAWVNHRLDSNVRATVLSMSGQVDSIGQISSGPLLGIIARRYGIRTGLLGSVLLLLPVLPLLLRQLKNGELLPERSIAPESQL